MIRKVIIVVLSLAAEAAATLGLGSAGAAADYGYTLALSEHHSVLIRVGKGLLVLRSSTRAEGPIPPAWIVKTRFVDHFVIQGDLSGRPGPGTVHRRTFYVHLGLLVLLLAAYPGIALICSPVWRRRVFGDSGDAVRRCVVAVCALAVTVAVVLSVIPLSAE